MLLPYSYEIGEESEYFDDIQHMTVIKEMLDLGSQGDQASYASAQGG
jgi:hypothetical protein